MNFKAPIFIFVFAVVLVILLNEAQAQGPRRRAVHEGNDDNAGSGGYRVRRAALWDDNDSEGGLSGRRRRREEPCVPDCGGPSGR